MRKNLLLMICAFAFITLNAQINEDFSDYTVGGKIGQQAQDMGRDYWTTWSGTVGGPEDGVIGELDGSNVAQFTYGNDQVLRLGRKTTGLWELNMKMYIPTSQVGYFNILADFAGTTSTWAIQVYFDKTGNTPGVGTLDANGVDAAGFTFGYDVWIPIKLKMDLDNDTAEIHINNVLVHSWRYTAGTSGDGCARIIDALDIYPPLAGKSNFYVDDIVFSGTDDASPVMSVNTTSIQKQILLEEPAIITETITINNTGTSMGDYLSRLSFEAGTTGTEENFNISYCSDEPLPNLGIGYNITEPSRIELAVKFPYSYYCDKVGAYIKRVSYFVPLYSAVVGNNFTFNICGVSALNGPGEIIETVAINTAIPGEWNEVTLPNPVLLDGQDLWVVVDFIQEVDGYPICTDSASFDVGVNWIRRVNTPWSEINFSTGNRNFMIKAYAEGYVVPACWLTLEGNTHGSIPVGGSADVNVKMDSEGLPLGTYTSTVFIETSDPENPLFEIPCLLRVVDSIIGIGEYTVNDVTTKIFPNPATDNVTVECSKKMNDIQMINSIGQVVYSAVINEQQVILNTSGFNSGIYFLKVSTDAGTKTIKLMIQ